MKKKKNLIETMKKERKIDENIQKKENVFLRELQEEKEKTRKNKEKIAYYKQVIANSNDAIVTQDFNGVVRAWNEGAEQIYGFKAKEMIGKNIIKIIAKEDRRNARKNIEAIKKGKPQFRITQTRITKDKKKINLWITYSPIYEDEEIIEIATTEQDVTKSLKSIKILKESEERYRRLFETAKDAILILDAEKGEIVDANPFIQDLLEYSKKELVGKNVWEVSPLKDALKNKKKLKELQKNKYIRYENLPLETKSGEKKYVEFVANVYPVGEKKVIQCNIRDITIRKKAEEELQELNIGLEKKVEERTSELQKANEELKELDLIKTDFFNTISHELKTPLTAMTAHLEILLDKKIDCGEKNESEINKSLNAVKRNNDQLRILIDNLLEISRIQSKTFKLNIEKVNVRKLALEVLNDLEILAKQSKIKIIKKLHKIPKISGDKARLVEVFNNLISNAIKFTEKGYIKVTCQRKGKLVLFKIIDTGIGIKKKQMSHLFEKFYQGEISPSRKNVGVGLGLSISKQLIELQGGTINIKSVYGKGSVVTIKFPIKYKKVEEYIALGKNKEGASVGVLAIKKNPTPLQKENIIVRSLFQKVNGKKLLKKRKGGVN